ncbi:MAG TPA: hypothetical protein PK961_08425 [bacterium]|nr:hypothetical protein [bacterium]
MRIRLMIIVLCLLATTAGAESGAVAWRAPDGAVLWRGGGEPAAWELLDADGDGAPEVAVFLAGAMYTRVEIDTDRDGRADRVYLFQPDGSAAGYLDADGNGVLETPPGSPSRQQAALREIGRGGALFKKALEMRLAAQAGELERVDKPAPPIEPPFARTAGKNVAVFIRLSLIPGAPPVMLHRKETVAQIGEFELRAPAGVGWVNKRFGATIRTDATDQRPPEQGAVELNVYPVYALVPAATGEGTEQKVILQISGRVLRPGLSDELFFFTQQLDASPSFIHVPARDDAGREVGQMLIEMILPQS